MAKEKNKKNKISINVTKVETICASSSASPASTPSACCSHTHQMRRKKPTK